MKLRVGLIVGLVLAAAVADWVRADDGIDCFSDDNGRSIAGCTALIERKDTSKADLSVIYAKRGTAYSLKGNYETAIRDLDVAIDMQPNYADAINNRAWAYYRLGKLETGLADVEKALELKPSYPYSFDTRAHIRQALGQPDGALRDFSQAMTYGGRQVIELYQCGLAAAGLYRGEIDGVSGPELQKALKTCVRRKGCSPVPAGEKCPIAQQRVQNQR